MLHADPKIRQSKNRDGESLEAVIKSAARSVAEVDEGSPGDIEITTRAPKEETEEAIENEARKGFDILIVGMGKTLDEEGAFDRNIEDICAGFRNPIAIAVAKGAHLKDPAAADLSILVPVSGSAASRRGAEVAIALAHVSGRPLRVVYGLCVNQLLKQHRHWQQEEPTRWTPAFEPSRSASCQAINRPAS